MKKQTPQQSSNNGWEAVLILIFAFLICALLQNI